MSRPTGRKNLNKEAISFKVFRKKCKIRGNKEVKVVAYACSELYSKCAEKADQCYNYMKLLKKHYK